MVVERLEPGGEREQIKKNLHIVSIISIAAHTPDARKLLAK